MRGLTAPGEFPRYERVKRTSADTYMAMARDSGEGKGPAGHQCDTDLSVLSAAKLSINHHNFSGTCGYTRSVELRFIHVTCAYISPVTQADHSNNLLLIQIHLAGKVWEGQRDSRTSVYGKVFCKCLLTLKVLNFLQFTWKLHDVIPNAGNG